MQVLNVAANKISGKLRLQGVPKLRALIANDNAITAVKGAAHDASYPRLTTIRDFEHMSSLTPQLNPWP